MARMPLSRLGRMVLAATCAQLGEMDRARAEVAEVLRLEPRFTLQGMCRLLLRFKLRTDSEHYREGLLKAGMPERAPLSTRPNSAFTRGLATRQS